MKHAPVIGIFFWLGLIFAGPGLAQIPRTMNYQGSLKQTADGAPVTAAVSMQFSLYDSPTAPTPVWGPETQTVTVNAGVYSVILGAVTPLNLPFDKLYYLGVAIQPPGASSYGVLTPRQPVTSVPYALRAASLDGLTVANGNVGIGTTAPAAPLEIRGSRVQVTAPDAANNSGMQFSRIDETSLLHRWAWWHTTTAYGRNSFQLWEYKDSATAGGCSSQPGTMCDPRLVIAEGGNIGINRWTPEYRLDVNGAARISGNLSVGSQLDVAGSMNLSGTLKLTGQGGGIVGGADKNFTIYQNTDAVNSRAWIAMWGPDATRAGELALAGTYVDLSYGSTTTGWGQSGLRLASTGNVGIGTTTPQYKLDVNGIARANNVSISSDQRWKTDIAPLANALARVSQLRGTSFRWQDPAKGAGPQLGLIAQEVEAVFPEVVSTDSDGYKSVAYDRLVAPLIEAVKELKTENDALKAENTQMKAEFERRLAVLEAQRNRK